MESQRKPGRERDVALAMPSGQALAPAGHRQSPGRGAGSPRWAISTCWRHLWKMGEWPLLWELSLHWGQPAELCPRPLGSWVSRARAALWSCVFAAGIGAGSLRTAGGGARTQLLPLPTTRSPPPPTPPRAGGFQHVLGCGLHSFHGYFMNAPAAAALQELQLLLQSVLEYSGPQRAFFFFFFVEPKCL